MRLGVLSDTHGQLARTEQAVQAFREAGVAVVIHCGDVGAAAVVELFEDWPAHFVYGNVDDPYELRVAIARCGKTFHERFGTLELEGKRIAFLHSDDARLFRETVRGGQYDLVCYGHTHSVDLHQEGPTKVLNPGAVYRSSRPSVAIVDLPSLYIAYIAI